MGSKDITITCISLLTGLKSNEAKPLTVISIRCLLVGLHLSKAWCLLLRLFLWWQCLTWGLPFVLMPPHQARTIPTATQHLPWVSRLSASVQTLQGLALTVRKVNTSTCFHISVSLLQEASLWVRHKPQQYWPCIQSTHWKRSFVSKW